LGVGGYADVYFQDAISGQLACCAASIAATEASGTAATTSSAFVVRTIRSPDPVE
jgi:hypothetical protein